MSGVAESEAASGWQGKDGEEDLAVAGGGRNGLRKGAKESESRGGGTSEQPLRQQVNTSKQLRADTVAGGGPVEPVASARLGS